MLLIYDRLYAGRLNEQGDVRLVAFTRNRHEAPRVDQQFVKAEVEFDLVIPHAQWPAMVSYVSRRGDHARRYYLAQAFHQNMASDEAQS